MMDGTPPLSKAGWIPILAVIFALGGPWSASAELRIDITRGTVEPLPLAVMSVLKTVEDLKPRPPKPKEKTEKKKKAEESFEAQVAKALQSQARRHDIDRPITISEIDLVRRQIARCWNLQAGAKEAENLIIEIFVDMRRGIIYSVLFHAVVLTVGFYGMPSLRRLPPAMDAPHRRRIGERGRGDEYAAAGGQARAQTRAQARQGRAAA